MLSVDVWAGREDARPWQTVGRDHPPQLVELVVPLTRVAERGHAVAQLPQRQLGIVLDVEMQIDQAGDHRPAGEIDAFRARRGWHCCRRPDAGDAIAVDDDAAVLDRCGASAIDNPYVLEHHRLCLRPRHGRRRNSQHEGDRDRREPENAVHWHAYANSGPSIANSMKSRPACTSSLTRAPAGRHIR